MDFTQGQTVELKRKVVDNIRKPVIASANSGGRDAYESMRSLNQNLTFQITEKEFLKRNVPFGINQFQTLEITL